MFDVHFKLRYTRKNKQPDYNLPATIQFVVNIDGIYSSPRSTGISVMGNKWSGVQQKIIGSSEEVQSQNRRLSSIKAGLDKLHQELCLVKDFVTPQYLVDVYVGKKEKRITVMKSFECLLEELKNPTDPTAPILKQKTLDKYDKCYEYLGEFLRKEKWEAIEVVQFTHPVAEKYRRFLYSKEFGQDHVSRYVSYLKKSFALSKKVGDTDSNPIFDVPCPRTKPKKANPLTFEQLERLVSYRSQDIFLQQTADVMVFLAFTGLDYCDYVDFDSSKDIVELKGVKLITMKRTKLFRGGSIPDDTYIPLLAPAKAILDKYNGFLPYLKYATLLKNLKHILRTIGVNTEMSVKNLRKTFGSYLLNKGLRMEVIRDSMGHSTIKQTEESYTIVFVDTLIHAFKQAGLI